MGVEVGVLMDVGRRLVGRSVWTRVRPQGPGMVYRARVLFLSHVSIRERLRTNASTIVCTLQTHWMRAMETLFQALRMSRYNSMSWAGRRQFIAARSLGVVFACVLG